MNRIAKRILHNMLGVALMAPLLTVRPAAAQTSGLIRAWGLNGNSQCNVPAPNSGFIAVSGGDSHSLGLKNNGSVVAWGNNSVGQLNVPAPNSGFIAVSAGYNHSLGLKSDGSIVAWGLNGNGQLNVPAPNSGFIAIAAGLQFSLALKNDGSIVAWGNNGDGQLNVPAPNSGFIAVSAGANHSVGLKSVGSIVAWGHNGEGQLNVPSPNSGFIAASAGWYHNLGLKSDGTIRAWGQNFFGQVTIPSPNSGFIAVGVGSGHSLGLKSDGSIVAWGRNDSGQCNVPASNSGFSAVAAGLGGQHSLGLKPPGLSLNPVSVCNTGTQVIMKIRMTNQTDLIVGGQFFLQYDNTRLDFVSASPGSLPFTEEVFESVNEGLGTIDYAVSVLAPSPGTMADTDMVMLTFDRIGNTCSTANLVSFRTHTPPTQLTNILGDPILTLLNDLTSITIDNTPPVISPGAGNMTVECNGTGNTVQLNAWLASRGGASATDNCSAVNWTHNFTALSDLCGATGAATVQFTATDACGNFSTTTATFTIQDTTAPVFNQSCPRPTIVVNADAGGCTAMASTVNAVAPTATDACSGSAGVVGTRSDSQLLTAAYPTGNTTITWTATDACGNFSVCLQTVTVNPSNTMLVSLQLAGSFTTSFTRCIRFEIRLCSGAPIIVDENINFVNGSATAVAVNVPCGLYDCITARDRKHTLRRTDSAFFISGLNYIATFTGADALVGGNLNDDVYIDILDFGVYLGQYNTSPGAGTLCGHVGNHADISGDGTVFVEDYTFIGPNFLQSHETNCCSLPGFADDGGGLTPDAGPVTRISVKELQRRRLHELIRADLNHDGWLDELDIVAFLNGAMP